MVVIFRFSTLKLLYMKIFNFLALFLKSSHFRLFLEFLGLKISQTRFFQKKTDQVSFKPLLTSNLRHNIKKIVRADFEIKMIKPIFRLFLGFFPKKTSYTQKVNTFQKWCYAVTSNKHSIVKMPWYRMSVKFQCNRFFNHFENGL